MEVRRPAGMYIYQPQNHEPLDAEGLSWLADQLCSDTRVHHDRTMSIGWITSQAAYEYPAMYDALATAEAEAAELQERVAVLEGALQRIAAFDDDHANEYLAKFCSYAGFDEPSAVRLARTALSGPSQ